MFLFSREKELKGRILSQLLSSLCNLGQVLTTLDLNVFICNMKRITRTYSSSWRVEWTTADRRPAPGAGVRGQSPLCYYLSSPPAGYESVQRFWVAGRLTSSCFPLHVKVRTTHLDLLAKGETVWILRGGWRAMREAQLPSHHLRGCYSESCHFSHLISELLKKDSNARAILGSHLSRLSCDASCICQEAAPRPGASLTITWRLLSLHLLGASFLTL